MNAHPRLAKVVAEVFQERPASIMLESGSSTLSRWDSLGHIRLMFRVEQEFSVKFTPRELMELKTVGAIQSLLEKKGALA